MSNESEREPPGTPGSAEPQLGIILLSAELGLGVPRENMPPGYPAATIFTWRRIIKDGWKKKLACSTQCARCEKALSGDDPRILSIYDHAPICMACKKEEESRTDYAVISKSLIRSCLAPTQLLYSDPGNY